MQVMIDELQIKPINQNDINILPSYLRTDQELETKLNRVLYELGKLNQDSFNINHIIWYCLGVQVKAGLQSELFIFRYFVWVIRWLRVMFEIQPKERNSFIWSTALTLHKDDNFVSFIWTIWYGNHKRQINDWSRVKSVWICNATFCIWQKWNESGSRMAA